MSSKRTTPFNTPIGEQRKMVVALAGALATGVSVWLAERTGVTLFNSAEFVEVLALAIGALLTGFFTWLVRNLPSG